MLRRLTISLKNPIKSNFCISQSFFKPHLIASISQNLNKDQQSNKKTSNPSPFQTYKREPKPAQVTKRTHIETPEKEGAIEAIFKRRVSPVKSKFQAPRFLETFNQETINRHLDEVWHTYLGIKGLVIQVQSFQKKTEEVKKKPVNVNIYLSNHIFHDQSLLEDLYVIQTQLYKFYEKNQADVIAKPDLYLSAVKSLSLFEKCHEHEPFWNQFTNIIKTLLKERQSLSKEDIVSMFSFFKILSKRSYYLRSSFTKNASSSALETVELLKRELFNFLLTHSGTIGLSYWISLLFACNYTDEKLISDIGTYVNKILEGPLDRVEAVKCFGKVVKKKAILPFSNFFEPLKRNLLSNAKRNQLTVPELGAIFWSINKENGENFNNQEFEILWNNLRHNITVQKEKNFSIFTISTILTNFLNSNFVSEEKFIFLQECALTALETSNTQIIGKRDEFERHQTEDEIEEGQYEEQRTPTLESNSCISILNSLAHNTDVNELNFELIQGLLSKLRSSPENIYVGNYASLLYICAKLVQRYTKRSKKNKLEKPCLEEITKRSLEFVPIIGSPFLAKIQQANGPDIARAFLAYSVLGCMDSNLYKTFESTIFKDIRKVPSYFCLYILQGILFLKEKDPESFNTQKFEERLISKVIFSVDNLQKEGIITVIQNSEHLSYLGASFVPLGEKLEEKFCSFLEQINFTKLSYGLSMLSRLKTLKTETFEKASPIILKLLMQSGARLKDLYYIIKSYVNTNHGNQGFFQELEEDILFRLKSSMKKEYSHAMKEELNDFVLIFNDLAKFNIQNDHLISSFESYFNKHVKNLQISDIVLVINGMTTYLSQDINLIKQLLSTLNDMLKAKENRDLFLESDPSLIIQGFQQGIFTIELEYKEKIDLTKYKELNEIYTEMSSDISKYRFREPTTSTFQKNIVECLKELKYDFKEEHPIGIYVVDIFIEPNLILEINGPSHYTYEQKEITWRKAKKTRQLKKMGYKVAVIPFFEWNEIEISELKFTYIKNKLDI